MGNSGGLGALCLCLMFYELLGLVNEQDSEQDVTRDYVLLCCSSIV